MVLLNYIQPNNLKYSQHGAVQCVRRNFECGVVTAQATPGGATSAVASSFSEVLEDEAAEAGIIESLEPKGLFLLIPKGKIQGIRRGSAKYTQKLSTTGLSM